MTDATQSERYWKNLENKGWFHQRFHGVNAHGLEVRDAELIYERGFEGQSIDPISLENIDRYRLKDIHDLAVQEAHQALSGEAIHYGWMERLGHYVKQPDFREEVLTLGALPLAPEDWRSDPGIHGACHARWEWYNQCVKDVQHDAGAPKGRRGIDR